MKQEHKRTLLILLDNMSECQAHLKEQVRQIEIFLDRLDQKIKKIEEGLNDTSD